MNILNDGKKPVSRTVKLTPDLDRKLANFKQLTGVSQGRVIREGLTLFFEKYAQAIAQPPAAR